jgi:DNA modification methylase
MPSSEEFCSQLESLLAAEELRFGATPGFGEYKRFLAHAVAHPAKMNVKLLEFLIKSFTRPGDIILDPMCGSGSTGVIAALNDRRAVQVDIEHKFVDWAEVAKRKVMAESILWSEDSIRNICGDARKLSELLTEIDAIVTSPPYANGTKGPSRSPLWDRLAQDPTSSRYGRKKHPTTGEGYGESQENIGNLPFDAVITSPPYADLSVISYDNTWWTKYFQKMLSEKGYIEWEGKCYTEAEWRALNHGRIDGRTARGMKKGTVGYSEVDAVITSPPYGEAQTGRNIAIEGIRGGQHSDTDLIAKRTYMPDKFESKQNISCLKYDAVITSPPYHPSKQTGRGLTRRSRRIMEKSQNRRYTNKSFINAMPYSDDPQNIGNLPRGNIDVVITSPPYSNSQTEVAGEKGRRGGDSKQRAKKDYANASKENIASLPLGEVDAVITSPPFADGFKPGAQDKEKRLKKLIEVDKRGVETGQKWATTSREALERRLTMQDDGYGKTKENIGNLPFDAVITSPPYEQTRAFQDFEFMKSIAEDQSEKLRTGYIRGHFRTAEAEKRWMDKTRIGSIEQKSNIGNLEKETYLEAMLKVYGEMFKILKSNGLAIIVIKPFIRNKQVVDLPFHTWLLLERVGFALVRLFKLRLEQESFWRVIYARKYHALKIAHEYILVCRKP